jgi:hypothetical protein
MSLKSPRPNERRRQIAAKYFNFINEQTYHCFVWVSEGGLGDVRKLIAKAYERIESEDKLHGPLYDITLLACEELAEVVKEELDDRLPSPSWYDIEEAYMDLSNVPIDTSIEGFTGPMLENALQAIRYDRVAEALLRQAGRYNPEIESP